MKSIFKLTIILILICHSQFYSQSNSKEYRLKVTKNSKGLSLKVKDLKAVEKNGKTSWTVKAIITNNFRDTLFYFIDSDCQSANFLIYSKSDTTSLIAGCENTATIRKPIVIALPPKGQQTVDLEINAKRLVTSSIKFSVGLSIYKAKNMDERRPPFDIMRLEGREIWLVSNRIKT